MVISRWLGLCYFGLFVCLNFDFFSVVSIVIFESHEEAGCGGSPVMPTFWRAEAEGLLEPRSQRPVWVTWQDLVWQGNVAGEGNEENKIKAK